MYGGGVTSLGKKIELFLRSDKVCRHGGQNLKSFICEGSKSRVWGYDWRSIFVRKMQENASPTVLVQPTYPTNPVLFTIGKSLKLNFHLTPIFFNRPFFFSRNSCNFSSSEALLQPKNRRLFFCSPRIFGENPPGTTFLDSTWGWMGHGETAKGTPKLRALYHRIWGIVAPVCHSVPLFGMFGEENMNNGKSFWSHTIGRKNGTWMKF